jgi:hypothetical protein
MISPFLARILTVGFKVLVLYLVFCGIFSTSIDYVFSFPYYGIDWMVYVIGMMPYIVSRIFIGVWVENDLVLESGGVIFEVKLSDDRFRALKKALGYT